MVELSSVISVGLAGGVKLIIPVRILHDINSRAVNEATTCSLLRYAISAKLDLRFECVHAYCQLAKQPGKHFCDKILPETMTSLLIHKIGYVRLASLTFFNL